MNYQQLDKIADLCNPIFAVALIVVACRVEGKAAWLFLLRTALSFIVVQQLCKFVQKHGGLGPHFPSTHFAVALVLAIGLVILKRRFWPISVAYLVIYGALMLFQHYHTPVEMLGAFFAVPLVWLFHLKPKKARVLTN